MTDSPYRPTLTFPSGAYNATQVRLYGIVPKQGSKPGNSIIYPQKSREVTSQFRGLSVTVSITTGDSENDAALNRSAVEALEKVGYREGENDAEVFQRLVDKPGLVDLDIPLFLHSQVTIETKKLGVVSLSSSVSLKQSVALRPKSCGIVVAYAFEGHTYDLPKPKIMIIPALPENHIPKDDSGFDAKESEGYAVWIVDKLDECIEFEMNQGFIDQIVLEANLPGKRAPNMYVGRMMLGHRSGRLSE